MLPTAAPRVFSSILGVQGIVTLNAQAGPQGRNGLFKAHGRCQRSGSALLAPRAIGDGRTWTGRLDTVCCCLLLLIQPWAAQGGAVARGECFW